MLNRLIIAWLFVVILVAPAIGVEQPVVWTRHIYLPYIDGVAENQKDLKDLFEKKWNERFMVLFDGAGVGEIHSCKQLLGEKILDAVPSAPRDFYLAKALQSDCYALSVALELKGFARSYMARDIRHVIEQIKYISAPSLDLQTSRMLVDLRNMIAKCADNECTLQSEWGEPICTIALKARGDFNGDSLEDWVISISIGGSTGDPAIVNLILTITKTEVGGNLKLLDIYPK